MHEGHLIYFLHVLTRSFPGLLSSDDATESHGLQERMLCVFIYLKAVFPHNYYLITRSFIPLIGQCPKCGAYL